MKDGLRVFDADTHVEPTAEVLDKYVDLVFACVSPISLPIGYRFGPATRAARQGATFTDTARFHTDGYSARRRRVKPISGRYNPSDGQQDAAGRRAGRSGREQGPRHGGRGHRRPIP